MMPMFKKDADLYTTHSRRAVDENGHFVTHNYTTKAFDEFEKQFKKKCMELIKKGAVDRFSKHYMEDEINAVFESAQADLNIQRIQHVRDIGFQAAWKNGDDAEFNNLLDKLDSEIAELDSEITIFEKEYKIQNGFGLDAEPDEMDYEEYDSSDEV